MEGDHSGERQAYCSGWKFIIKYFFGNNILPEKDYAFDAHELIVVGTDLTPDAFSALENLVGTWNNNCLTWVTP